LPFALLRTATRRQKTQPNPGRRSRLCCASKAGLPP
jgi:hypothetical protein